MRRINGFIITGILMLILLSVILVGCNKEEVADEAVEVSDYLSEQALAGGEERQLGSYIIEEAVEGTFVVKYTANAQFYIQDSVAAYAEYEYGTMLFDKILASTGDYVEAGEAIAQVHIDVSEADLTAARLSIQRMEERVEVDRLMYEKEDAKLKREVYSMSASTAQNVAIRQYEATLEYHRQDLESQYKAIERAKENLAKMEEADAITEITAPISGYIKDVPVLVYGRVIPNKMIIGVLEPQKSGILTVNNEKNAFRYGKEVEIVCKKEDFEKEFTGVVITPSQTSVASQATDKKACIRLDEEGAAFLQENKVNTIEVTVKSIEQENAVMVKMGALELNEKDKDNTTAYATIVQEDGSFLKKKVVLGGMNEECYWVLEGINASDKVVVP